MDELYKVTVMAIIQGITEFLPVSSSGHLVLAKHFLNLESPGLTLEIYLHAGTLLSVIFYFHKKIISLISGIFRGERLSLFYALKILVSMIPAGLFCILFKAEIDSAADNVFLVSGFLCITGLLLMSLRVLDKRNTAGPENGAGFIKAILIGLGQAVAVLPGISRSGATICTGRWLGLRPSEAAEFSFLMSIPVIAGATILEALHLGKEVQHPALPLWAIFAGIAIAAVVGCLAIGIFMKMLKQGIFWIFGIYCLAIGIISMLFYQFT